jgi:protein involved in polysaccharide export with SLBB domain
MDRSLSRIRAVHLAAILLLLVPVSLAVARPALAQNADVILGEPNRIQIVVHIIGEVKRPGEYQVPDDTDVLELLAKAGGPTEIADLSGVSLRRRDVPGYPTNPAEDAIVNVDLDEFLKRKDAPLPPVLQPGDVVTVPRNKMHAWKTVFTMVRDVSVVVTTYLLYRKVIDK